MHHMFRDILEIYTSIRYSCLHSKLLIIFRGSKTPKLRFYAKLVPTDTFAECIPPPPPPHSPKFTFFSSHKLHIAHNNSGSEQEESEANMKDDKSEFYDMEMSVDESIFEGELGDLKGGAFVSFRYHGEYSPIGPPINPLVSLCIYYRAQW